MIDYWKKGKSLCASSERDVASYAISLREALLPWMAYVLVLFIMLLSAACANTLSTEEGEIRVVNIGGQEIIIGDGKIGGGPPGTVEPPVEQRVAGGGFSYMPFAGFRVVNSATSSYMTNDDYFTDAAEVTIEGYPVTAGESRYNSIDDAAAIWLTGSERVEPAATINIDGASGHVIGFQQSGAEEYAGQLYLVQTESHQVMIFVKAWPISYWQDDIAPPLAELLTSIRLFAPEQ